MASSPAFPARLTLYGAAISSCSARLRIALGLLGLPYTPVYVDMDKNEHRSAAYTAINPSRSLPTLVVEEGEDENETAAEGSGRAAALRITQSAAALEYLAEEGPALQQQAAVARQPGVRLLPATAAGRARVRTLMQVLVADVQPRTSNNCREKVVELAMAVAAAAAAAAGADHHDLDPASVRRQWSRDWHIEGLRAYEGLLGEYADGGSDGGSSSRLYSLGDEITLADVCLVPVVWNAVEKWGIRLEDPDGDGRRPGFVGVARVYGNMMKLAAVRDSHWGRQPDCPAHLRAKE